ncbi:MAG: RsmD family RNA methyltransferase [Christensenellaceae bacterium]|jgi:16S rRNA G966 N2-methylase RsmD|nr:RsmD family RNA methyltransferase [Christensenellaceae bacterium]
MRIIAGKYKGRKLAEYFTDTTRPTTDRVKENVFNVLSNLVNFDGISVLDLFAGTGQYGIECLSRGAKFVAFNDFDTSATQIIKKNLKNITGNYTITDWEYTEILNELKNKNKNAAVAKNNAGNNKNNKNVAAHNKDNKNAGQNFANNHQYDLIFLDPPYFSNFGETAIKMICDKKLLKENGIIVFETDKDNLFVCTVARMSNSKGNYIPVDAAAGVDCVAVKKYGKTHIYFLQHLFFATPALK